jgi:tetrapyrrole methylase family protein/MazG family protein/ATP diphosphatase
MSGEGVERLLRIMARLRDPAGGCAWDLEQTFETIAPYTIEEAYEVDDAIRRGDLAGLRGELGDLLLQVVFHAQMASERGAFGFDDVVAAISEKLVRRHPNVFGGARVESAAEQMRAWDRHKAAEREQAAVREGRARSALDDVPLALPALARAQQLVRRAASEGFSWPAPAPALDRVGEELGELRAELDSPDRARRREELGDLLFAMAALAHALDLDAEAALRDASAKFESRLRVLEADLAREGLRMSALELPDLLERWDRAKRSTDPG